VHQKFEKYSQSSQNRPATPLVHMHMKLFPPSVLIQVLPLCWHGLEEQLPTVHQ